MFGRHCAVLGTTGGGKSWTVARLIEQAARLPNSKVILLDATGEFHTLSAGVHHLHLGEGAPAPTGSSPVDFPYWELTEADLFALFKPSGQTQAPKLRQAMKSLKIAHLEKNLAPKGFLEKAHQPKATFEEAYTKHAAKIENSRATFIIRHLSRQIVEECVWPSGKTQGSEDAPSGRL